MFGKWPHEVAQLPFKYFLKLRDYYLETKKTPKDPGAIEVEDLLSGDAELDFNSERIRGEAV